PAPFRAIEPAAAAYTLAASLLRAAGVPRRALLVVVALEGIHAPLVDVAVHVVESPGVRLEAADRAGAFEVGPFPAGDIRIAAVEVRLVRVDRVAGVKGALRAGAASCMKVKHT